MNIKDMVTTYRDFQWIVEEYPWVENSLFVTYVQAADPPSVIDALTVENLGTAKGLTEVNERGWNESSIIGATQIGTWTVAIAPGTFVVEEKMQPLAVGRRVLSHSKSINADCELTVWEDGNKSVSFDPLLRTGFTADGIPALWKSRMREVGIDPEGEGPMSDGLFHILEASFAMAANYTGLLVTPEIFASSEFVLGDGHN